MLKRLAGLAAHAVQSLSITESVQEGCPEEALLLRGHTDIKETLTEALAKAGKQTVVNVNACCVNLKVIKSDWHSDDILHRFVDKQPFLASEISIF